MSWSLRPMVAADIDLVLALEQAIPEAPHWGRSAYADSVATSSAAILKRAGFIVHEERLLLGFAIGKLVAGVCEIESITVVERVRGQGIGLALVTALASWAAAHGAIRLELEVRASNTNAIRLYERAGLRQEGLRACYYDAPEEDAVLMGKALSPTVPL